MVGHIVPIMPTLYVIVSNSNIGSLLVVRIVKKSHIYDLLINAYVHLVYVE